MTEDFGEIRIPKSLLNRLEEHVKGSEFTTVDDLATYLLRRGLAERTTHETLLSDEEEEKIKQRLRDLGYLD